MSVKKTGTVTSRHSIEEIGSTNHIACDHFLPIQNATTRHGHGTARPYRKFFTVIRSMLEHTHTHTTLNLTIKTKNSTVGLYGGRKTLETEKKTKQKFNSHITLAQKSNHSDPQ
jgi:hypothetical protein